MILKGNDDPQTTTINQISHYHYFLEISFGVLGPRLLSKNSRPLSDLGLYCLPFRQLDFDKKIINRRNKMNSDNMFKLKAKYNLVS